ADIHDGPEHKTLQSKAGYIDARPHIPQLEEVPLQRTAGPYIWVKSRHRAPLGLCPLYPQKRTNRRRSTCPLCAKSGHANFDERAAMTEPFTRPFSTDQTLILTSV